MKAKLVTALVALLVSDVALAASPGDLGPATSNSRYRIRIGEGIPATVDENVSGTGPGVISRFITEPNSGAVSLVSGSITYGSNPTLSAFVNANGASLVRFELNMNYDFRVTAADQAAYDAFAAYLALDPLNGVKVTGNYAVNLTGTGSSDASSSAVVDAGFGPLMFRCTVGGFGDCTGVSTPYTTTGAVIGDVGSLSFNGSFFLSASAFVAVGPDVGNSQQGYAMIDPVVSLPQGFMGNPSDYLVAYSPNLSSVTPEPGSWALLITGFGLVGATSRRARRRLA